MGNFWTKAAKWSLLDKKETDKDWANKRNWDHSIASGLSSPTQLGTRIYQATWCTLSASHTCASPEFRKTTSMDTPSSLSLE